MKFGMRAVTRSISTDGGFLQSIPIYSDPNKDTEITPPEGRRSPKEENSIIQFSILLFKEDIKPSAKQITRHTTKGAMKHRVCETAFADTRFKLAFLSNFSSYDEGKVSVYKCMYNDEDQTVINIQTGRWWVLNVQRIYMQLQYVNFN